MDGSQPYPIVVGVDGSPASRTALRWAHRQATLTGGSLTALMAWDSPLIYDWKVPGLEDFANTTAKALNTVLDEVVGEGGPVEVRKEVAQGHPARALLDAAEATEARLLVVGNRGHGGFTRALLGSVSQHCVHHARCPVMVVRASEQ
ncbi:universal stress protein [Parasphingorhabdus pacifica]